MKTTDKRNEILDCAQFLIQRRGYNGFSFADIAERVDIRKASIHHYFPTKTDLIVAVVERYREAFNASLLNINSQKSWITKLELYAKLYEIALEEGNLCLCGMLASEMDSLPEEVKSAVRGFLADNEEWLVAVLHSNYPKISKKRLLAIAWQTINLLQGGLIMARILDNPAVFSGSFKEMMSQLKNLS